MKYIDPRELYNDIVNEVSEETLNKIEGEEKMKKMLIGGLVLLMMSGLFVGCPEKPEEEKGNSHNGLKVAEEYRGDWYDSNRPDPSFPDFQLTSSERINWVNGHATRGIPAWTVDNELWIYEYPEGRKIGTFTDESTFNMDNLTYVKK